MEVRYRVNKCPVGLGHRGKYSTYLGIKRPGYGRLERASIRFGYVCTFFFSFSLVFFFSFFSDRGARLWVSMAIIW